MRTKRKQPAEGSERTTTRRKQPKNKGGAPKLSLWECGIGAVWK
jgi:hypothetical protein